MSNEKLIEIYFSDLNDVGKLKILGRDPPVKTEDFKKLCKDLKKRTNYDVLPLFVLNVESGF